MNHECVLGKYQYTAHRQTESNGKTEFNIPNRARDREIDRRKIDIDVANMYKLSPY